MESKVFFGAILLLSSWVFVGSSQSTCMTKVLPCQEYLKSPSSPPPSSCCTPLLDMIKEDQVCLCEVFNNLQLLDSFNVSQDEVLKLPKACGGSVDISMCESSSDGEEATTMPPDVSKEFEELKDASQKRKEKGNTAATSPTDSSDSTSAAAGPTDNSISTSAATPSTTTTITASAPSANSPSEGPSSSKSDAGRRFAQGSSLFVLFIVAWMTLLI